jgi:hypothetical protein
MRRRKEPGRFTTESLRTQRKSRLIRQQVNLCASTRSDIFDNQLASFPAAQLFVGVEQLNPINGPIRGEVNIQRFADVDRFDLGCFLVQAQISDFVLGRSSISS